MNSEDENISSQIFFIDFIRRDGSNFDLVFLCNDKSLTSVFHFMPLELADMYYQAICKTKRYLLFSTVTNTLVENLRRYFDSPRYYEKFSAMRDILKYINDGNYQPILQKYNLRTLSSIVFIERP